MTFPPPHMRLHTSVPLLFISHLVECRVAIPFLRSALGSSQRRLAFARGTRRCSPLGYGLTVPVTPGTCTTMAKPHPDSPAFVYLNGGSKRQQISPVHVFATLRLYWPGSETRANLCGGQGDARAGTVGRSVLVAAVLGGLVGVTAVAAAGEQFLPVLSMREGAMRALRIPLANGFIDYVTLLNERDGGINGVKLVWEECETVYDVDRGVECYERLKRQGAHGGGGVSAGQHPARLCPDGAGHARPDPPARHGRWARGRLGWAGVSVCLQPPGQLLESEHGQDPVPRPTGRRHGAAQGPENRPCLPRLRTMAGKPSPSSTPRPPSTALRCSTWRCNRRGSTRRRPGCGSRSPSPTGSSCAASAS